MSEIKTLAKELQDYTRVVGSHNKHIQSVANRLVELTDQPQLNENQKVMLDELKDEYEFYGNYQLAIYWVIAEGNVPNLSINDFIQILQAFRQWVLEQEEE